MSDHPFIPRPRLRLAAAIALGIAWLPAIAAEPQQATPAQTAAASDAQTIEALTRRLEALERSNGVGAYASGDAPSVADLQQRLAVLERKLELQEEAAAAKAAKEPTLALSAEKGLSVKSASGDVEVKLRGLVQADAHSYLGDDAEPQNDTFLLRRVEPTIEGSWGKLLGFRIQAQLAGESASLNDAYFDLKFDPRATLRAGKFKTPFGLEQLQSSGGLATIERGLPSELTPVRDYGVQLQGAFAGETLNYAIGVFNGTPDGRDAATSNPDEHVEYAARVFAEPWKNGGGALAGLGFGLAGSIGEKSGSGNSFLPRYRTPGQVTFFRYDDTVTAQGRHDRWSPQAYWYYTRFGAQAEYVSSRLDVQAETGERASLDHRGWQLTTSVVLTGEDASYRGVVRPNKPFAPGDGGWGAFELVGRYGELDVDDDAFPLFADPSDAASAARAWTLGLNWYLTSNFKLVANYTRTSFDGGAETGDREDEQAFFARAQFQF